MKKAIILLIIAIFVTSCVRPSKEYQAKEGALKELRTAVGEYCYLNQALDPKQAWNIGVIYFNDYYADITSQDKSVIKNVSKALQRCDRMLVIIGHSSDLESNTVSGLELSYKRANNAYQYLKTFKVQEDNIQVVFCSNNVNRFIEDNFMAQRYNQRVEFIMFPPEVKEEYSLLCLPNK